jgi:hypothetical protein
MSSRFNGSIICEGVKKTGPFFGSAFLLLAFQRGFIFLTFSLIQSGRPGQIQEEVSSWAQEQDRLN